MLIGEDIHNSFLIGNINGKPFETLPAPQRAIYEKMAQALNVRLGLCGAEDEMLLVMLYNVNSLNNGVIRTTRENVRAVAWELRYNGEEGDQFTIYSIKNGRETGWGQYLMVQDWTTIMEKERGAVAGLYDEQRKVRVQ